MSAFEGDKSKGTRLNHLDITYAVMDNVFYLFRLEVWYRRPVKLVLAPVAWLIPIASIITPATLTVRLSAVSPTPAIMEQVPNLLFMSLSLAADMPANGLHATYNDGKTDLYFYDGPSQALTRVAQAVGAKGAILQITPPAANASWKLDFFAPALKCENIDGVQRHNIARNLANYDFKRSCEYHSGYLAWTEGDVPLRANTSFSPESLGREAKSSSLYVVTAPNMWSYSTPWGAHIMSNLCYYDEGYEITLFKPMGFFGVNSTMLQCQAYNASYNTKFGYLSREQHVTIKRDIDNAQSPLRVVDSVYGPSSVDTANCRVLNRSGESCVFDQELVKKLAYQSVLDAFNQQVIGSIYAIIESVQGAQRPRSDTRIVSSTLMHSPELAHLRNRDTWGTFGSLQSTLAGTQGPVVDGLDNVISEDSSLPLQHALEEMFQNLTISLMSSEELRPNASSLLAPPMTRVTVLRYRNVYVYSAFKLRLSYGLAILLACLSILVGILGVFKNKGSYSGSFSTILPTSRFAHVTPDVREIDADGRGPSPEYLSHARVIFSRSSITLPLMSTQPRART